MRDRSRVWELGFRYGVQFLFPKYLSFLSGPTDSLFAAAVYYPQVSPRTSSCLFVGVPQEPSSGLLLQHEPKKFNQSCVYVWPTSVLMLTVAVGSLCCFWLAGQHPPGPPLPLRLFCLQLWISFLKLDNRKMQYKYYSQVILENQVLTARQDTTWRPETEYLMKRPKLPILFFGGGVPIIFIVYLDPEPYSNY